MPTAVPLGLEPVSSEFYPHRHHLQKAAPPPHLLQSLRTLNSRTLTRQQLCLLAHRVLERNSKLHHWSDSDTLKKYNK